MLRKHLSISLVLAAFSLLAILPAAAQQPATLRLWIMPSGIDLTRRIGVEMRTFEDANPTIQVEVEFVEWNQALNYFDQARNNLRQPPDVVQVGSTWISSLAGDELISAYSEADITAVGGSDAFVPALWEAGIFDDNAVAIPWFIDTRAIIYRRDIFDQLGIDPNVAFSSWEQFDATLQMLSDANLFALTSDGTPLQIYPIAIAGRPQTNAVHDFAPWIWGAGGDFLDAENSQSVLSDPQSITGIQFYTNLHVKGYTPPNIQGFTYLDSDSWFLNRRAVMTVTGAWLIQRIRTTGLADDIGVALLPPGEAGRYAFVGGSGLAVWNGTTNPEAALTLVQFLTSEDSQQRFTRDAGLLPARNAVLEDSVFVSDPDYSMFASALEFGRAYPQIQQWASIEVALSNEFEAMWQNVAFAPNNFAETEQLQPLVDRQSDIVNAILALP
jgi:multiple sugar transport system substrate-binding protein